MVVILLYTLFSVLTSHSTFAGYTKDEFITYIFLMHLLRSFIFGSQSRQTSSEINDGTFSVYLLKPVKHFSSVYMRELGERSVLFLCAILELLALFVFLQPHLQLPQSIQLWGFFFFSTLLGHILYCVWSYLVSLIAFWSREAYGPRFLFEWFLEFASGIYFPLSILSPFVFWFLQALPFFYMLYVPLQIYLGKIALADIPELLMKQLMWIFIGSILFVLVYKKGLRRYSGEGM